jgi:hypothetical protein
MGREETHKQSSGHRRPYPTRMHPSVATKESSRVEGDEEGEEREERLAGFGKKAV